MTLEDLASYYPRQDPPLRVNYSNMDVYAPPVPAGGPDLLFALNVMELLGLSPESAYRNLTYQHLVEVSRVQLVEWLGEFSFSVSYLFSCLVPGKLATYLTIWCIDEVCRKDGVELS